MRANITLKTALKLVLGLGLFAVLAGCGSKQDDNTVPPPSAHAQVPAMLNAPLANHPARLKALEPTASPASPH